MLSSIIFVIALVISAFGQTPDCLNDPTNSQCQNYVYPNSKSDVSSMCSGSMSNMPGCTLFTLCQDPTLSSSPYCNNLGILRILCSDMSMGPCNNMKKLCSNGSVVAECKMETLPLPTSVDAANDITGICNSMQMAGCSECGTSMTCDLLTVYSNLCLSMPAMNECAPWKNYCALIPDWPLCSSEVAGSTAPPQMMMYFHTGFADYILFESWVPRNAGQYAGSWFAVFIISALYEGLKVARWIHELPIIRGEKVKLEMATRSKWTIKMFLQAAFQSEIVQALLRSIENGVGLLVMLIAMTYNVGLFFAIIAGTFSGWLIFGRFRYDQADASPTELPASTCC